MSKQNQVQDIVDFVHEVVQDPAKWLDNEEKQDELKDMLFTLAQRPGNNYKENMYSKIDS